MYTFSRLLSEVRSCNICLASLAHGVNPVIAASPGSKLVIIGQAPGRIVHATGIPWDDKSGDNLRRWLDMDAAVFYDPDKVCLMPMGFCYPGTGKSGDLPPRPECAPLWHERLLELMPDVQLILLVGQYAQNHYLKDRVKGSLTETVRHFNEYLPLYFPLPHPSPRNNIWQARNTWFGQDVLPGLREQIDHIF